MEDLKLFMKTLMLEAGFKPEQLFDDIVDDATDILLDRLVTEIMTELSEEDRDIFVEMADTNEKWDNALEFARMKIKNYDEFMQEKLKEFRKEYLEGMKNIDI
jgi:hypothetical protein